MKDLLRKMDIRRGDIFFIRFDKDKKNISETRAALICSNDIVNEYAQRIVVAPITSNLTRIYSFEYVIKNEFLEGRIMFDQIRTIDRTYVLNKIHSLSLRDMNQVDMILKQILSI